jgi:hypothetical protein
MSSRRLVSTLVLALTFAQGCGSDSIGSGATGGASGAGAGGSAGSPGGAGGPGGSGPGGVGGPGGAGGTAGAGGPGGAGGAGGPGGAGGAGGMLPAGPTTAREFTAKIGRAANFLVGMGNDLNPDHNKDGAYTLGVRLDLHYAYLVGLPGSGGWPDWNPNGTFVNVLTDSADRNGVVPMFTLYAMAAMGENRTDVLTMPDFMQRWWRGTRLMFERLAVFNKPAVVHLEPDFWAYMQQKAKGNPASVRALVKMVPECADLPDDVAGLGHCILRLGRAISPKVLIGFHASGWGGPPADTVAFLNALGAGSSDFVATDALDRDAGCFEARVDPNCQRQGKFYWDESNATSPNFNEHLGFVKTITDGLKKPMLWWQVPFGVPSTTPGGTAKHYRDNRVRYLFSHIPDFIAAGFVGAAFGTGAQNQTYIDSDGDQFKNAVTAYFAKPVPLP